ncbi:MAG TPA: ABC transporter substrate-binding protein [Methylomirabilota bacterium]|nr:ABC transporter substrate-binding protein [Methylomirabilota bacterium]
MKRIKMNPFWRWPVSIALLWLLPGAQAISAQTKVSIANLIVSSSHLPLWIAHEQGLFARQGIDVELLIVEGVDASRRIAGDIPFGVIGIPAAISAASEGRDLKVLVTLDAPRVTGHLVAGRDIKTADALRGKRLGVNRLGTDAWIHSILALDHLGLDPQRDGISFVEIGNVPQLVQALEAGGIDAVVIDPGQSAQLRGKGFSLLLDMYPANISGVQSALVVAGAYSRQHPDVVEKVVAGLVEGIGFSLAPRNEEIVRKTLMARMKISAPAAAESGYRNFLSRANRKPYASITAMRNMQRVMALNDPKVLSVKIEDLADDRFVRKLDESGAIDRLYESYGVK